MTRIVVNSWLCPLLVCEQDKVASWRSSALHSEVAMKGLDRTPRNQYFFSSVEAPLSLQQIDVKFNQP